MNRISTLDGMRGVAILFVLCGHAVANFGPSDESARAWLEAFANAGLGVRIFFVLSGYLITQLLLKETARNGKVDLLAFYGRRARRILPAYYTYLIVLYVIYQTIELASPLHAWIAAGSFTWNYAVVWSHWGSVNLWDLGHVWSLAMEAQFYLLWPLILVMLRPRAALFVAIVLVLTAPVVRVGSYFLFPEQRGFLGMMLHTGADGLLAGCATALLIQYQRASAFLAKYGPSGAILAGVWMLILGPILSIEIRGFNIVVGFTLNAFAAAWLIAWVHLQPSKFAKDVFGSGLLPRLGVVSYSLYLWQQVFINHNYPLGPWPLRIGIALLAAVLSYKLIEQPLLPRAVLRPDRQSAPN